MLATRYNVSWYYWLQRMSTTSLLMCLTWWLMWQTLGHWSRLWGQWLTQWQLWDLQQIHLAIRTVKCQLCLVLALLKFKLLSKVTPKFHAEMTGVKFWLSIGVGKKQSRLPRCFCVPILRNSVLFGFNNILLLAYPDSKSPSLYHTC